MGKKGEAFERLLKIMDELREKCPWDKKQTMDSLKKLTIEEMYELLDEINIGNLEGIKEELGDILLHIVFYARIGSEKKAFDIEGVIDTVCDKLIERHPHIYGDVSVSDENEVKQNWEQIKLKSGKKSILDGVPNSLPAIIKSYRIQEKVAQVGFDWSEKEEVWNKVDEEINEFKEAQAEESPAEMEEEFGDLLFSLVNYSRFCDIDPEAALSKANTKFINRFQKMEELAKEDNNKLDKMTLTELDEYWEKAKLTLAK